MRRLDAFGLDDVREVGETLRGLGAGASSMEDVARRVVHYLYAELGNGDGTPACALVRLYKTHAYGKLEPDLQVFAREIVGEEPPPDMRCLTLLGTVGEQAEWNDRRRSAGHRTIPLVSEEAVHNLPMVEQLISQLGLELGTVVRPDPGRTVELAQRTYDAFHVETALGSPYLPAQEEFVIPYGIRSALGFGGMLPSGDFYAVMLFSRVTVTRAVADALKILALPIRVPLMSFALRRTFEPLPG